jgi:allantoin racemase
MARILILNPNSSTSVTASMDAALDLLRTPDGPELVCDTLPEGPAGIETQEHVEGVVLPLVRRLERTPADAYVIGCFSDPGLALARENLPQPVFGIAESALHTAIGLGHKVGIVAIKSGSIPRHLRMARALGLLERLAGDRPLNLGVTEIADGNVIDRIVEVGRELRDIDGANVLILGCASMGIHRSQVEARLGLPVVDPTQAAAMRAMAMLRLGYNRFAG